MTILAAATFTTVNLANAVAQGGLAYEELYYETDGTLVGRYIEYCSGYSQWWDYVGPVSYIN